MGLLDAFLELIDGPRAFFDVDPSRGVRLESGPSCTPSDVATKRCVGWRIARDQRIRVVSSRGKICADANGGVFATARITAKQQGRVVDEHFADRRQGWPRNGVARCRYHNTKCRPLANFQRRLPEFASAARKHDRHKIGLQQREQHLGLGITEATVELQQLRPVRGEHQSGVQHADIGRALSSHVVDDWLNELRGEIIGAEWHWRRSVGTHAARVGPGVAFTEAFVVLRKGKRPRRFAVAERKQRTFRAGQTLFQHHRAGWEERANCRFATGVIEGYDDALSAGETRLLDHDCAPERFPPGDGGVDRVRGVERCVCGRGQAEFGRDRACIGLRPLQF